ncbi:MAG TPA: hypothetical protein VJB14_16840, partial [Planctomycetota bacterium]|nr:hypothetical protein [Planctomycetota bacterium]
MDRTRALWIGFLAVWGFTLVAYGGVSVGASAIAAAAMAALNLAAARLLPDPLRLSRAGVLFLAGTAALFVLQLLPVAPFLFPVTHAWRQLHGTGGLWPATADTFRTLLALTQFALYILSVLLLLRLRQAGLGASTVLKSAVGVLSLEALYGLVQTFADLKDLPFFGPRPCYGSASGTLVGRNNFAGLMAVGFVIATALAWGRFSWPLRRPDDPGRPRWVRRFEGASPWACAAALFAVAILLSHSRGGAI